MPSTPICTRGRPAGDALAWLSSLSPMGRVRAPADVAGVVAFLASDDGRWVTGEGIAVAGGAVM